MDNVRESFVQVEGHWQRKCSRPHCVAFFFSRTGWFPVESLFSKKLQSPHSPTVSATSALLLEEVEKFSQCSSPSYCCLCSTQGTVLDILIMPQSEEVFWYKFHWRMNCSLKFHLCFSCLVEIITMSERHDRTLPKLTPKLLEATKMNLISIIKGPLSFFRSELLSSMANCNGLKTHHWKVNLCHYISVFVEGNLKALWTDSVLPF